MIRFPAHYLFAIIWLMAVACSSGSKPKDSVHLVETAHPSARPQLGRVPTTTPGPESDSSTSAAAVVLGALQQFRPEGEGSLQILIPQRFSSASAIDILRLSTGVGAAYNSVPPLLSRLGWSWLLSQDAFQGGFGYTQWRVMVLSFGDAGGASQYLANPVLLPAALLQGAVADSAFGPAPGTRMLSAPDTVVPLSAPEAALAGERAAFVWRRGRLVFQVVEAASPPPTDLSSLSRLARLVDQGRSGIPGGSEP